MKKRIIVTQLSKESFEERLKNKTIPHKTGFKLDYNEKDCYTLKRKENKFRIGHHVPYVWNHDGYWCEFLYGEYEISNNENIVVKYHFGKPLLVVLPFLVIIIMCFPIFLGLVYEFIIDNYFDIAIFISGIFSLIGFIGLFGISKKSRKYYIELLSKICKTEIDF